MIDKGVILKTNCDASSLEAFGN